jgi:hypothetical protein
MKRQRSRNRNGGGGGGGGKPQHNSNRAFDSNGPEGVKVRGAAQHVYEKYQQFARDAHTAGDRVLAENHLQHAEHYFRVMRAMQPLRPLSEIVGRDQFVSGYDIDFEDESGAGETSEIESGSEAGDGVDGGDRQVRNQDGRPQDSRPHDARGEDRPRDDYRQNDPRGRDDQPRQDRFQSDRSQSDRSQNDRFANDRSQSERPREERGARPFRDERPRYNREERSPRFERDPLGVTEPEAIPLTGGSANAANADPGHILRADDGEVSHAPAFLQVRPAEPRTEAAENARKPRRRRAPRSFEGDAAAPPSGDAEDS